MADRRGDCRVADSHLADAQEVGAAFNCFHAVSDGCRAVGLFECYAFGDVSGRVIERQLEHLETEIESLAQLIDRCPASLKIGDHLLRDSLRIGGNPLSDDTVIAGVNGNHRMFDARLVPALPKSKPLSDRLEPAKRARRLSQTCVAGLDRRCGGEVRPRHVDHHFPDAVERPGGCHVHCFLSIGAAEYGARRQAGARDTT